MNKREQQKKSKEWYYIQKILPDISDELKYDVLKLEETVSYEKPDFKFSYNNKTIGVEVVECHPSNNEDINAPERESFDNRICSKFKENPFLLNITKNKSLNILIDKKASFNKETKIADVCQEIEEHLVAWDNNDKIKSPPTFIRRIRAWEIKGPNIVQFNHISVIDQINWDDLKNCINKKNEKFEVYCEQLKFDEIWLCIFIPCEENKEHNNIFYSSNEEQAKEFISESPFKRIYVTSETSTDILKLK